jgi:hypothetical protein
MKFAQKLNLRLSIHKMTFRFLFNLFVYTSLIHEVFSENFQPSACLDYVNENDFIVIFENTIKRGEWDCANLIIQSASGKQESYDFKRSFELQNRLILKELNKLKIAIDNYTPVTSSVSPAFEWAQSTTEIYLNVKFSHKIDAPATLNVETKNVSISSNELYLNASDGNKNFNLVLFFYKPIVPEESKYEMSSVGRMTFNLKKSDGPSKWEQLLTKSGPTNMHVWFAMQEKYEKDLEKFDKKKIINSEVKSKNNDKNVPKVKSSSNKSKNANDDDDDDDDENDENDEKGSADQGNNSVKLLNQQKREEFKKVEEDASQRKKLLDIEWRENKRKIDEELKRLKIEIEKRIRGEIETIETIGSGSIQREL